ncbi:MAG: hypothetical protein ACE5J7_04855 [Candidatus Aenigmatarchaeota archaeon]
MSYSKLTPKAQKSYERLNEALSRYGDTPWAFGPPVSTVYWRSYIGNFTRIVVPRNGNDLEVEGFITVRMEPSAFERLSHIEGKKEFPVISAEDTIISLIERYDPLTAYHIARVNEIDIDYLAKRIDEEAEHSELSEHHTLHGDALKILHTFPELRSYTDGLRKRLTDDEIKKLSLDDSYSKRSMEFSMRKNYEPGPIDTGIWYMVNRALEGAESRYAKNRIKKRAIELMEDKLIMRDQHGDFPEDIMEQIVYINLYNFMIRENGRLITVTYDSKENQMDSIRKNARERGFNSVYMQHELDVDRLVEDFEKLAEEALASEDTGKVFTNVDF